MCHLIAIRAFQFQSWSGNAQVGATSSIFFIHVTLKFDRWPPNPTGISSMPYSVAVCDFKLELYSGNDQFESTWSISKFDIWPRRITGQLFYATSSFVHDFVAICDFKLELRSRTTLIGNNIWFGLCDLDLWLLTLTFCMNMRSFNGNYNWNFMMI